MLVIKLAALVALSLTLWLYSSFPGSGLATPWAVLLFGLAALVLFGAGRVLPEGVDKGLAILTLCVSLVFPVTMAISVLASSGENRERERAGEERIQQIAGLVGAKELSAFFLQPGQLAQGYRVPAETVEQLERHALALPPQEVKEHHLAESLLLGLEIEPSPGVSSSNFDTPALDAMCRLYVKLKAHGGFAPAQAPFYLQYRDRLVTRVAELGRDRWLEEIGQEHKAFQRVAWGDQFYASSFEEQFPGPPPASGRVVSRSLGSLPMDVLMTLNRPFLPAPPGVDKTVFPSTGFARLYALNQTREALELMRSRGVDFTEEELRDPGLQAFLETVRTTTPPRREP